MEAPLIVSCRLCLEPDELPSMVTIARLLKSTGYSVEMTICRPCSRAIKAKIEEIDNSGGDLSHDSPPAGAELERDPAVEAAQAAMQRDSLQSQVGATDSTLPPIQPAPRHSGRRTAAELKEK